MPRAAAVDSAPTGDGSAGDGYFAGVLGTAIEWVAGWKGALTMSGEDVVVYGGTPPEGRTENKRRRVGDRV